MKKVQVECDRFNGGLLPSICIRTWVWAANTERETRAALSTLTPGKEIVLVVFLNKQNSSGFLT